MPDRARNAARSANRALQDIDPGSEAGMAGGPCLIPHRRVLRSRPGGSLEGRRGDGPDGVEDWADCESGTKRASSVAEGCHEDPERPAHRGPRLYCTIERVIDAFLQERFTGQPFGAGNLRHNPTCGNPLRHAILQAWLPAITVSPAPRAAGRPSCHVAVYELVGSCTLVTAATPDRTSSATSVPSLQDRMDRALRGLTRTRRSTVAA